MNLTIGYIKGIKIQIHFTFWFIIIWGAFRYGNGNNWTGLLYGAALTLLLFFIVLLHELGHSFAALYFKIPVRDITLMPLGGLARLERMPYEKPWQDLIIAIAGPAVNVLLGWLLLPILWVMSDGRIVWRWVLYQSLEGSGTFSVIAYLFMVNLSLLIFNMIPAFPLDGGRVFRAILAIWFGSETSTRAAVWVGRVFAIALGIVGLLPPGNFLLVLISIFIFFIGSMEGRTVIVRNKLRHVSVREALSRVSNIVLQPNFTIMEVATLTLQSRQVNFPVMLEDALLGVIRRQDIRQAIERGHSFYTVAEVMERNMPKIDGNMTLIEAQEYLVEADSSVAAVYEDFQFVGLLGLEDIERVARSFLGQRSPSSMVA